MKEDLGTEQPTRGRDQDRRQDGEEIFKDSIHERTPVFISSHGQVIACYRQESKDSPDNEDGYLLVKSDHQ